MDFARFFLAFRFMFVCIPLICPGVVADGEEESQNQAVGLLHDSSVDVYIIYFACQFTFENIYPIWVLYTLPYPNNAVCDGVISFSFYYNMF